MWRAVTPPPPPRWWLDASESKPDSLACVDPSGTPHIAPPTPSLPLVPLRAGERHIPRTSAQPSPPAKVLPPIESAPAMSTEYPALGLTGLRMLADQDTLNEEHSRSSADATSGSPHGSWTTPYPSSSTSSASSSATELLATPLNADDPLIALGASPDTRAKEFARLVEAHSRYRRRVDAHFQGALELDVASGVGRKHRWGGMSSRECSDEEAEWTVKNGVRWPVGPKNPRPFIGRRGRNPIPKW